MNNRQRSVSRLSNKVKRASNIITWLYNHRALSLIVLMLQVSVNSLAAFFLDTWRMKYLGITLF